MHPTSVNSSSSSLQTGVEDLSNDVSRSHWVAIDLIVDFT